MNDCGRQCCVKEKLGTCPGCCGCPHYHECYDDELKDVEVKK
jgi:hypothetical protein